MARRAVVICDSPLFDDRVHGGLQAKCQLLLPAFASAFSLTLFCGDRTESQWSTQGVTAFHAFGPDCRFKSEYLPELQRAVAAADVLISIETLIPTSIGVPAVLIMGGVAYEWSAAIIRSHAWDMVITPSHDAAARARRVAPVNARTINNGYDWRSLKRDTSASLDLGFPAPTRGTRILVHPHRPEAGKGAAEACWLLAALLEAGHDIYLGIPEQGFHTSDRNHYATLKESLPASLVDRVIFHRWLARHEMPRYYSAADATLALGDVPEGFGATIAESIACGAPVLASRRGAVSHLFPEDHGLFLVDPGDHQGAVARMTALLAMEHSAVDSMVARGRDYCLRNYDAATMVTHYIDAVASVIR